MELNIHTLICNMNDSFASIFDGFLGISPSFPPWVLARDRFFGLINSVSRSNSTKSSLSKNIIEMRLTLFLRCKSARGEYTNYHKMEIIFTFLINYIQFRMLYSCSAMLSFHMLRRSVSKTQSFKKHAGRKLIDWRSWIRVATFSWK